MKQDKSTAPPHAEPHDPAPCAFAVDLYRAIVSLDLERVLELAQAQKRGGRP